MQFEERFICGEKKKEKPANFAITIGPLVLLDH